MKLCILPARGGSRRVPRKNIRPFFGKPMMLWPIETAKASGLFDLVVVSTDDAEIAKVAFEAGCWVAWRAVDDGATGTQEIAARVLEQFDVHSDASCVIYPTSPLLEASMLNAGLARLRSADAPPFVYSVGPDGQDAGCFYWGWALAFRSRIALEKGAPLVLPEQHVCDINTEDDWQKAESMFNALRRAS